MKVKFIVFSLLSSLALNAQMRDKNGIELSVFTGVNSSTYYGDVSFKTNNAIYSPAFGINADFYSNDRWSVKMGFEYQTLGSQIDDFKKIEGKDVFSTLNQKLHFINLPINANYHFGYYRNWNLNFGPSISFLAKATTDGEKVDIENFLKKQVGFNIGIGYKFEITDRFSLAVEHQEYISITSNYSGLKQFTPFVGNVSGSFNVRAIYYFKDKERR